MARRMAAKCSRNFSTRSPAGRSPERLRIVAMAAIESA